MLVLRRVAAIGRKHQHRVPARFTDHRREVNAVVGIDGTPKPDVRRFGPVGFVTRRTLDFDELPALARHIETFGERHADQGNRC